MAQFSKVARACAIAMALGLSACGGGGGGGTNYIPPPPPAPPPPPPPPPPVSGPPAGTFSWDYAVPVPGARMSTTINLNNGATAGTTILGEPSNGAIRVQENRGEYAVWSGQSKWDYDIPIFVLQDLGAFATTGDETGNFDYFRFDYDKDGVIHRAELQLLKNSAANSRIQLSYLTYGIYSDAVGAQTARQFNTGVFVLGQETDAANMPRAGSGTYAGIVDGYASVGGTGYRLLGSTGTLSADFASGVIATTLVLRGNSDFLTGTLGSLQTFGTLTGTGAITSATNEYGGSLAGLGMTGSFAGQFYGPSAQETGYAFGAVGGGDTITGVFVGKQ